MAALLCLGAAQAPLAWAATPDVGPSATPAQTPTQNATPSKADQAVTSYPPSFFTSFQPNTALDMVNDLPGFSLDTGDSVRGFAGSAGNVLIDGERPASKTDGLDQILQRIPASSVARIDVIRGSAPPSLACGSYATGDCKPSPR